MRGLRLAAAIAGALLLPLAFAPRLAHAEWAPVLGNACGANGCASKEQVCQFWGNFYGYWIGDLTPVYNNGTLVNWHCTVIYSFNGGQIGIDPFPTCPAGIPDAMSPSGCSGFVPSASKLLGVTACNYCIGMVGNPINGNTGNKVEIVTDYESAGPQKLAFVRSYNSQATLYTSLGAGWRSNFDRQVFSTALPPPPGRPAST